MLQRTGEWELGEVVGSGGAGTVHLATSSAHGTAVIKLVPKKGRGALRELLVAVELWGRPNIVPVLDTGGTDTDWALLMPKADRSLRDHIDGVQGPTPEQEALPILIDVARALDALTGVHISGHTTKGVVHRDLKPENVLYFDGSWCLSDFGIARYVDKATAQDTTRYFMTQDYAAPEQWRGETATSQTDIYALGVIAFELLMGVPPFTGADLRGQHLDSNIPRMDGVSHRLAAVIAQCLYKQAGARPSSSRLVGQLEALTRPVDSITGGMNALQAANLAATVHGDQQERRRQQERDEAERRESLLNVASLQLLEIGTSLKETIIVHAPTASPVKRWDGGWQLRLNKAMLALSEMQQNSGLYEEVYEPGRLTDPRRIPLHLPFDVIAHCCIAVGNFSSWSGGGNTGRAHSLWFCDAEIEGRYQWYETAFDQTEWLERRPDEPQWYLQKAEGAKWGEHLGGMVPGRYGPFAAKPTEQVALWALGEKRPYKPVYKLAWPFTPLFVGRIEGFVDRWATWFAEASQGKLPHQLRPGEELACEPGIVSLPGERMPDGSHVKLSPKGKHVSALDRLYDVDPRSPDR